MIQRLTNLLKSIPGKLLSTGRSVLSAAGRLASKTADITRRLLVAMVLSAVMLVVLGTSFLVLHAAIRPVLEEAHEFFYGYYPEIDLNDILSESTGNLSPIVRLLKVNSDGKPVSVCSASIISKRLAITAAHCVEHGSGSNHRKIPADESYQVVEGDVKINIDGGKLAIAQDIAMVSGNFEAFRSLRIRPFDAMTDQDGIVVGYPHGGRIPSMQPAGFGPNLFDLVRQGARGFSGMSGGPILGLDGYIIAIMSAHDDQGSSLIEPIFDLEFAFDSYIKEQK